MAEIIWKTKQEIEDENNIPTLPTIENRVTNAEVDIVTLEETINVIFGGV